MCLGVWAGVSVAWSMCCCGCVCGIDRAVVRPQPPHLLFVCCCQPTPLGLLPAVCRHCCCQGCLLLGSHSLNTASLRHQQLSVSESLVLFAGCFVVIDSCDLHVDVMCQIKRLAGRCGRKVLGNSGCCPGSLQAAWRRRALAPAARNDVNHPPTAMCAAAISSACAWRGVLCRMMICLLCCQRTCGIGCMRACLLACGVACACRFVCM